MRFADYKCECGIIKEFHEGIWKTEKHYCDCGLEMKRIFSPTNFTFKQNAPNSNLKHSERREKWNSPDPAVKI